MKMWYINDIVSVNENIGKKFRLAMLEDEWWGWENWMYAMTILIC